MPVLTPNQPVTVNTPDLLVENRLPAGRHRFSLRVRNARGVESEAAVVVVTVAIRPGPIIGTPVITTPVIPTPVIVGPIPTPPVRPRRPGRKPR